MNFISSNTRYDAVQGSETREFGSALQDAGYATDPSYADKIGRILDSDTMKNVMRGLKEALPRPITLVQAPVTDR